MYKLKVRLDQLLELKNYGDSNKYEEVVAILLGKYLKEDRAVLTEIVPIKNVFPGNKSLGYIPDPNDFYKILSKTSFLNKKNQIDFIGIFHTHPFSYPYPSDIDLNNAGYSGFYLIYSVALNSIKSFYNKNPNDKKFLNSIIII